MDIAALVERFTAKRVTLWVAEGQLHYRAPIGVLGSEELATLRAHKSEIVRLIQAAPRPAGHLPALARYPHAGLIPLAREQWPLWDSYVSGWGWPALVASARQLQGPLDVSVLHTAAATVHARYEALRTSIERTASGAQQRINVDPALRFDVTDLSGGKLEDAEAEARRLIYKVCRRQRGPIADPSFELQVYKLARDLTILVIGFEHLFADGVSIGIIWSELEILYSNILKDRKFSLPRPALQFSDYTLWQHETLSNEEHREAMLGYWRHSLAGAQPLALPRITAGENGLPRCEFEPIEISAQTTRSLQNVSARARVTRFTAILAAVQCALCCFTGSSDIVLAIAAARRSNASTARIVGMLADVVFVRTRFHAGTDYQEIIPAVGRSLRDAEVHDAPPLYSLMSEALHLPRELCMIMINYRPVRSTAATQKPRSPVQFAPFESGLVQGFIPFHLVINVIDSGAELTAYIAYQAAAYSGETIKRLADTIRLTLQVCLSDPTTTIMDLRGAVAS
jgi:hypothetical protein